MCVSSIFTLSAECDPAVGRNAAVTNQPVNKQQCVYTSMLHCCAAFIQVLHKVTAVNL